MSKQSNAMEIITTKKLEIQLRSIPNNLMNAIFLRDVDQADIVWRQMCLVDSSNVKYDYVTNYFMFFFHLSVGF